MSKSSALVSANRTQNIASDPLASAFVSASAGSGKTKLLIDRLLRLMLPVEGVHPETGAPILLPGTEPGRIQCLTFTKAAAAEMANRLQSRLGSWVSLPDVELDRELSALDVPTVPETRQAARALFVRVLDLPGGMKIGTIHAFCQSLLRRFPLEAAVNPHFTLLEDTDANLALSDAIERTLGAAEHDAALRSCLDLLAGQVGLDEYLQRVRALRDKAGKLGPAFRLWETHPARVRRIYAALLDAGDEDEVALIARLREPPEADLLRDVLRESLESGSDANKARAAAMLDWLAQPPATRRVDAWRDAMLTKEGKLRATGAFFPARIVKGRPELFAPIEREAERVQAIGAGIAAQRLLALNLALFALAAPTLTGYARDKTARGLVDYDDLIAATRDLLREPGAAWVLYKLDGGIDHLLLDEVQDTSGTQWEIAGALTAEFFAGEGAREDEGRPRTVFAVGDFKQSIYAFQGADPQGFHEWRERFAAMVTAGAQQWRDPGLNVSFRSVRPVLQLVDAVFSREDAARGLREPGSNEPLPHHVSARAEQGGRVELWPLVPRGEKGEAIDPWDAPSGNTGQSSPPQLLADELARWIAAQIGKPPQPGQPPLRAGDVLVLVPRRSPFLRALIRALKGQGVEVATLVRVELTNQLAVQDLVALCEALLLPQDDLTLAAVLTSPLGDLSDNSLMALAMDRGDRPLWTELRERHAERPDWTAAWNMLSGLQRRIDFATPYQLLADALGQRGGRARLLRRLGPEAAEPTDDLLAAALRYEALHPPSMQGFLHWLRASETTVKREPEATADAVRIMTVHGAKGLQARLVVLPDMTGGARQDTRLLWAGRDGVEWPIWAPGRGLTCALTEKLASAEAAAAQAERNRLLYVALTRASDWLVICGWESGKTMPADSWYALCQAGFGGLNALSTPFEGGWDGERLVLEETCRVPQRQAALSAVPDVAPMPSEFGHAPGWRSVPPVPEGALTRPLAPSRPDGVQFGATPPARSPLEWVQGSVGQRERALRRGTLVHRLLQFLPDQPPAARAAIALDWLNRPGRGQPPDEAVRLTDQIMEVLAHPVLAPLFLPGSLAEQAVTGIAGGAVIVGQVDRLRVSDDAVYICDYKTSQRPPVEGQALPAAYLRQMAAYAALLRQIYPGRVIRASLVWTEGPRVSVLTEAQLRDYAPDARAVASSP
ncbi:DNA helicase II [Neoasaia chiangmaiensis NBRC 101099]|uniref:DNA 3'-5' helicase n=1 Tax=Neoasaia chiangmaiensis TaxID=320497 RepID=A0A1U9KNV5_9PROT|nr:double-strand break repair helicase AddA [Neoasaia chiangmaiensis]AQS87474.1 double-strand break repair helicase AddA [Neoasaia chiangmaiensis]GBR42572.1 DNA helicase II [Neoasaia chiangmaiensis NBRC 101099]GEN16266.1 double-strand break repair helicase AddA [Neoasaia chiangmaiensis]